MILAEEVIDNAKASALPLPPALVTPPQLPEAAGIRHEVAGLRLVHQEQLKRSKGRIIQIPSQVPRKGRRFEELHASSTIR